MDRSSPQRWPDIEPILDRALELAPQDRAAFLDSACQGNPALRAEVERLLRAAERAGRFLATPAPAYAAPLVDRVAKAEALPPGTRFGAYQIERELGHGGMATVWLAKDVRHHRQVAVKVLHPELSAVLGSERFLKEIELTANLQHPHILPLFDSGEAGGHLYYVMPYIEGESLRSRLVRERLLPVADAVRIATDVADALAYAHRHGVIHRDIKPENILLHDGRPLVADFGIALAVQQAGGERMTQTGLSLGTPQYMAPEQATGERSVDLRADVYALGAVTYEMLSGEPPFTGPTAQAVVARMLTEPPPPIATRRRSVPEHVEAAVLTALEKLPADRFASATDFAGALSGAARTLTTTRHVAPPWKGHVVWRWVVAGALILAGAALASVALRSARPTPQQRAMWLEMVPPPEVAAMVAEDLVLSPDGSRYLFGRGRPAAFDARLVVRSFADTMESVLEGTTGARQAIWSPDGRSIAFLRGGVVEGLRALIVLPLDGRPPVVATDSATSLGAWLASDTIVYTWAGSVMAVSARGGRPRLVRAGDSAAAIPQLRLPAALPGRHVLVTVAAPSAVDWKVGVVSLDTGALRILAPGVTGRYVRSGHVLLTQFDGRVLAARFDTTKVSLAGATRPVLTGVSAGGNGVLELSVAEDGTLLYQAGGAGGVLVAVARNGDERVLTDEVRPYNDLAVSPNGRWVATGINGVLWSLELNRRTLNRLSPGSESPATGLALFPIWNPDGRSLAYTPAIDTYTVMPAEGGDPSVLFTMPGQLGGAAWSPDGRVMIVRVEPGDLRAVDLGSGAASDFVATRFTEQSPSFSPDGRWVAYASDESGRSEVYVRRAHGGGRIRISVDGGVEPAWSSGGHEIFFRGPAGFMAAAVTVGDEVVVRRIDRLFDDRRYQWSVRHREYEVLPGDSGFVFIRSTNVGRVFVRFGWAAELDSLLRGS